MATTLDDLQLSESNASRMVLVNDDQGDEYICNLDAIRNIPLKDDEEKQNCVRNQA
jgi:hypothetical protein